MKHASHLLAGLMLLLASLSGPHSLAEPTLPEGLEDAEPQQLMAVGYGLMALNDDEKASFQETIRKFGENVRSTISRELRRDSLNKERRIKSKVRKLFSDLDGELAPIVTEARRPAYQIFKKGLMEQMQPQWGGDLSQLPGEIPGYSGH